MKRRQITYIAEELAWIEAHKDWSRKDLHRGFVSRFMRPEVTRDNIKSLCFRRGWKTGRTGCFEKGAASMNKGKKMPYNAKSAATQFKKGQRPINKQDVGYERIDRDGYVMLCIAERNPWTGAPTRMYHKHRYLWEQLHGKVPKGHFLKCLDGNRTNTDPSNWECLPEAMKPRFNGRHTMAYDPAPAELKPTLMAIAKLEQKVRSVKLEAPSK